MVHAVTGPPIVFVHGSAADATTWSIQLSSSLRERFTLIAYDRGERPDVAAFAGELAGVIPGRALVVGSSFGAVIALELLRTRPALVAGAVLIEPPMAASDDAPAVPAAFLAEFDRRAAADGGPAAGEFFLRTVLGDAAYDRIPRAFQDRSKARWAQIRTDSAALIAYRPRYGELSAVTTPVLLVGGDRSAAYFRPTLEALARGLARARLELITGAGHMLHAEAPRKFGQLLEGFAAEVDFG